LRHVSLYLFTPYLSFPYPSFVGRCQIPAMVLQVFVEETFVCFGSIISRLPDSDLNQTRCNFRSDRNNISVARNSLLCADVPLRNYSLTSPIQSRSYMSQVIIIDTFLSFLSANRVLVIHHTVHVFTSNFRQ